MVYNNCANPNNICSKYIDKIVEGWTITYISGSVEGDLVSENRYINNNSFGDRWVKSL